MDNASLRGNVAQENARRRVTEELMPRQSRLNEMYGPPDIPIPAEVTPYQTFQQPTDAVQGFFDPGTGTAPDSVDGVSAASNSPAVSDGTQGFAAALGEAVSALGPAMAAPFASLAAIGMAIANMDAPDNSSAVDAGAAGSADASAGVGDSSATAVDGVSAADAASMADAAAAEGAAATSSDGGAGGGAGGSKIVCTAMNQAYGFGAYRQAIWLDYSAKRLTNQHERGYHRIFRPLVRYAFHSGNSLAKRNVRQFLEYIMRLRTADLRAEMRGKNPHPVRRVIRRTCEYICYLAGKP